jgi:mono/diheme cytochrome c family protein
VPVTPAKAPAAPAPPPEKPKRPEVVAAESRKKIPWWAVPAVAGLPVWAVLYAGTLEVRTEQSAAITLGQEVYEANGCGGCHGAGGAGQGDVFPGFTAGEVALTFPDFNEQLAWIRSGSAGDAVGPDGGYGDPARPGGQHNVASFSGVMPGFPDLSDEEVLAVARYEREVLGEVPCEPELAEATGEECAE